MVSDLLIDASADGLRSPLIGEDVFLSKPYRCRENCCCKQLSECSRVADSAILGSTELAYGPNWTWEHNFDPSFIEPCFPSVLNHTKSWEDVFSDNPTNVDGIHFIKEIFVNDRHAQKPDPVNPESPKIVEPRQKFQRFRAKKFICDECDRSFTMKQNVQQHFFQYHHPDGAKKKPMRVASKRFQCTKCNKNDGELLPLPTEQARNRRPFKCEQCGMEFGRAGGLRRHDMMVHQQKKHACPYEGCSHPGYKCTKALAAHIRSVHTLDRPFACLFCERTFVRKNDLKVHELTHSTQCEFICAKCNNSFRRLIYLQKHEKRCSGGVKRRKTGIREGRVRNKVSSALWKRRNSVRRQSPSGLCGRRRKASRNLSPCVIKDEPVDECYTEKRDGQYSSKNEEDVYSHEKSENSTSEPLEGPSSNAAIKEEPLFSVMKEEPLEEGEIYESHTVPCQKLSTPSDKKPSLATQCASHSNTKIFKKSVIVNLAYISKGETSSKKGHSKAFLKLPMKSTHKSSSSKTSHYDKSGNRSRKRRLDEDGDHEKPPKIDSKHEMPDNKSSSASVAQNESLEEGEIMEVQESHGTKLLRRRLNYEPRDEAVIPKKRPRRP